ncbi:GAF domain protein [Candidatus Magnetomorum sp. HK-1]|nr:GAF domain protein [Candidatus Magnetomorum sp. HK-1]
MTSTNNSDTNQINKNVADSQRQAPKAKPVPPTRIPPALEIQQLRQKLQRLELAMEISRQFSATLDVDKLMQTILDKVAHVTNAEAGSFWIKDKQTNMAICHVAVGPVKHKVLGLKLKSGTGIVGWVIENKQKTVVFDTSLDERFFNKVDEKVNFITKSILCVPLLVNNECVGAISLINKKTPVGQFNQQDVDTLELLAMSGAIAIKNAQLFQSERKIKELKTLLTISREITSTLDLDRVLLAIVNLGSQVIFYKRAVIGLIGINNKVTLSAETNIAQPDMTEPKNKQIKEIMKYVLDSGNPVHVVNFQIDSPPKNVPKIIIDYLKQFELQCISIMIMSDAEGKLGIISMEGTYSSLVVKESNDVVDIVVNQATIAIRNAQLYKNMPSHTLSGKLKSSVTETTRSWKKTLVFFLSIVLILIMINAIKVTERVTAIVEVIPSQIMKVTSQTDGVVQRINFSEGDLVKNDQTIITLDSSLLRLERAKLTKDINIQSGELRRLQSEGAPFEVHLKNLEIGKLRNQLKIINKQISFTKITPLIDGRVLTQRTDQLINKQIMKGEVIAEIAANDSKIIEVIIDEADVHRVKANNNSYITLQAFPDILINGRVHSVSWTMTDPETEDEPKGYKAWIIGQEINDVPEIRFGMTGKAKIVTGRKTLFEIYFKPMCDRIITEFRLKFTKNNYSESEIGKN